MIALFATVGTDYHPFNRLIRWLDEWLETEEGQRVRCLVQHGTSVQPHHAESTAYMTYSEIETALKRATAVVCHAGPGTIMLARAAGKRPIVVPRKRELGEHVDNHQVAFARRISEDGTIWLAETKQRFRELLDCVAAESARFESDQREVERPAAVALFEQLVDDLVADRHR